MNYISTTEAAKLWGITPNRITILAKEGRIPGAKQISTRWMIPVDAIKPADNRRTKNEQNSESTERFFRFPNYADLDEDLIYPPLTDEEIILRSVQLQYLECKFEDAHKTLGDLPEKSENIYIKITSLFYACLLCTQNINKKELQKYVMQLKLLFAEDFPYKKEMLFLLYELDASTGANNYFLEEFQIDSSYDYHPSIYSLMQSLTVFSHCVKNMVSTFNEDLHIYELNCLMLENQGYYCDAQSMNIYLTLLYYMQDNIANATLHLRKALTIAESKHYYFYPAMYYSYLSPLYDALLPEFSAEFADKIAMLGKDVHNRYVTFMESINVKHIYSSLTKRDFQYALLVSQGLANKEIAAKLNVSESMVAKQLNKIYNVLEVNSKAELKKLFVDYNNRSLFSKE